MSLRIVADENIPHLHALFSAFGNITALPGRHITAQDVASADVLLVRSVTPVNEHLLQGSAVKFVGTCTIGTDHLATDYLAEQGIAFASAPGCNALAVVQYVLGVLAQLDCLHKVGKAVVVGGGNVGSRVYRALANLGFDCSVVDPFLTHDSGLPLTEFAAVYDADLICLHAPFTASGPHPTKHMFDLPVLQRLKKNALLINAGRGGVIDNVALLNLLEQRNDLSVVLDVWENEPDIHRDLLKKVTLGTPHIAGYSLEGRLNGALIIAEALKENLFAADIATLSQAEIAKQAVKQQALGAPENIAPQTLKAAMCSAYHVTHDHENLLAAADTLPASFDQLRKHYPQRREFSHYRCANPPAAIANTLQSLGFIID